MKWKAFELIPYSPFNKFEALYNGHPFLACIWGQWVAQAVYTRHYDAGDRFPGKYEFFCVAHFNGMEEKIWEIRIEETPFPITHWMPLPNPPDEK